MNREGPDGLQGGKVSEEAETSWDARSSGNANLLRYKVARPNSLWRHSFSFLEPFGQLSSLDVEAGRRVDDTLHSRSKALEVRLFRHVSSLLRSLVFEIIRGCPDLLSVAKTTLPKTNIFDSRNEQWTKDQLLRTYKAIVSQTLATRFCFFIDGLDKYYDSERNSEDLVNTVRELDLSSDVKLCISSRLYLIFLE
jgi:hypothetical protein